MKAKRVFEFHKGEDPLSSLGVGMNRKKFDSDEDFLEYLIFMMPIILGTEDIPDDIICDDTFYLKQKYVELIRNYINAQNFFINNEMVYLPEEDDNPLFDIEGYDGFIWEDLHNYLKRMGFKCLQQ